MTNTLASYALDSQGLETYLEIMVPTRKPIMLWGPPGVGKSQICQQAAARLGMNYVDVRAVMLDPVDLRGIPSVDDQGRTRWNPPVFLPPTDSTEEWLINLEELPTAPPMVQAALYQLALDRKIGEYTLPEGATVIACGNREGDGGVFHRFSPALSSRFHHAELEVNVDAWKEWAIQNDIAPEVIFFLEYRPDFLHQFDPRSREHSFPCPRTWEFVSDVTKRNGTIPVEIERNIYVGIIGETVAVEYCAFLRIQRELPHPNVVMSDPDAVEIPDNQSAILALCGALCHRADDTNFAQVVQFAKRLRPEVSEFLIWSCVKRKPELQTTKEYIEWAGHAIN